MTASPYSPEKHHWCTCRHRLRFHLQCWMFDAEKRRFLFLIFQCVFSQIFLTGVYHLVLLEFCSTSWCNMYLHQQNKGQRQTGAGKTSKDIRGVQSCFHISWNQLELQQVPLKIKKCTHVWGVKIKLQVSWSGIIHTFYSEKLAFLLSVQK